MSDGYHDPRCVGDCCLIYSESGWANLEWSEQSVLPCLATSSGQCTQSPGTHLKSTRLGCLNCQAREKVKSNTWNCTIILIYKLGQLISYSTFFYWSCFHYIGQSIIATHCLHWLIIPLLIVFYYHVIYLWIPTIKLFYSHSRSLIFCLKLDTTISSSSFKSW